MRSCKARNFKDFKCHTTLLSAYDVDDVFHMPLMLILWLRFWTRHVINPTVYQLGHWCKVTHSNMNYTHYCSDTSVHRFYIHPDIQMNCFLWSGTRRLISRTAVWVIAFGKSHKEVSPLLRADWMSCAYIAGFVLIVCKVALATGSQTSAVWS